MNSSQQKLLTCLQYPDIHFNNFELMISTHEIISLTCRPVMWRYCHCHSQYQFVIRDGPHCLKCNTNESWNDYAALGTCSCWLHIGGAYVREHVPLCVCCSYEIQTVQMTYFRYAMGGYKHSFSSGKADNHSKSAHWNESCINTYACQLMQCFEKSLQIPL